MMLSLLSQSGEKLREMSETITGWLTADYQQYMEVVQSKGLPFWGKEKQQLLYVGTNCMSTCESTGIWKQYSHKVVE